jgi:GT2 family glycosyltransferase
MMTKLKLSCSIVLFQNNREILANTIYSILKSNINLILFLIDNSPTNDLANISKHDKIIYIHNPSNPGYGASHNLAIKESYKSNFDFHLVINPDVYFSSGTLEAIICFMESNKKIVLLMPKILFPDNKIQFLCKRNPSFFDLFLRGFAPNFLKLIFKKRLKKFQYQNTSYDEIIYDVPYLSGCFMFFRTSLLKQVGYFDENIFMYLEDADMTRRCLGVGNTVYYPIVSVFHHYGGLTHKSFKFKLITIKSSFTYFRKWGWLGN